MPAPGSGDGRARHCGGAGAGKEPGQAAGYCGHPEVPPQGGTAACGGVHRRGAFESEAHHHPEGRPAGAGGQRGGR